MNKMKNLNFKEKMELIILLRKTIYEYTKYISEDINDYYREKTRIYRSIINKIWHIIKKMLQYMWRQKYIVQYMMN